MYIKRDIKKIFEKLNSSYSAIAVVGPRQAGKTTFLKNQGENSYVLFDDPDARSLFEEDIKGFEMQFISNHKPNILDEVQYCKEAGRKIKYLIDTGKKLWLTASSETALGSEVLSFLVGRVSVLRIYPFSLNEFLRAKGQKTINVTILKRILTEHIIFGGYPKVVLTDDREVKGIILKDLFETMVLKDIAQTFSISDSLSLDRFARYLSVNSGMIMSYDNISSDLNLSFQTVKKYLEAMEKSYLIFRVVPYFSNKSKEITKQPKVYYIDTGLCNTISKNTEISGNIFENYILSELLKKGYLPKYWRTKAKAEVDFIIEAGKEIIPIEVKIKPRFNSSLRAFIDSYKPGRAFIVNFEGENRTLKYNDCDVEIIDVKRFLDAV